MYGTRPATQTIKVRGRDRSGPIEQFKIAPGHVAVLHSGKQVVKVAVRQLPAPGDPNYRGEIIAVKAPPESLPPESLGSSEAPGASNGRHVFPQVGAESDFTLRNVFRVEV